MTHHNDQARALRGGMDPGDFMDEAPADAADAADVSCFGASSDLLAGNIVFSLGFTPWSKYKALFIYSSWIFKVWS